MAAEALNGDMTQEVRERTVNGLKQGKLDVVVATDVAARGLDVDRISHVVNYDIPNNPESYVHRIGRTGRAGRSGKALLLVHPRERYQLKAIERATGQRIPPIDLPSADDLSQHRIDRFIDKARTVLANEDMDFYYRLVARIEKEHEISLLDLAAALTYLSQGEKPFEVRELKSQAKGGRNDDRQGRSDRDRGRGRERSRDDRGRGRRDERGGAFQRDGQRDHQRAGGRDGYAAARGGERDSGGAPQPDREGHAPPNFRSDRSENDRRPQRDFDRQGGDRQRGAGDNERPDSQRPDSQRSGNDRADFQPHAPQSRQSGDDVNRQPYRIAVGYDHGVSPGEIVGAIANEIGIEGRYIGKIDIHDRYSVVGLPAGMPAEVFKQLRRIHVRGQALRARLWDEHTGAPAGFGGSKGDADDGTERPKRKLKKSKAGKKKKAARKG